MEDLTGRIYGTIKVLGFSRLVKKRYRYFWDCECILCKRKFEKEGPAIKRAKFGCLYCAKKSMNGESHSPIYSIWYHMKRRCNDKKNKRYDIYGARGIKVCDEWHNYNNFRDWALSTGYKEGLEIDRINVNGDYCPENCRWVNDILQANNRRSNVFYEIKGTIHTLAEWSRIFNIDYKLLWQRVKRANGSIEKAIEIKS